MPIVQACTVHGCDVLTMGEYCLEHGRDVAGLTNVLHTRTAIGGERELRTEPRSVKRGRR
jgi:hypothetical protein